MPGVVRIVAIAVTAGSLVGCAFLPATWNSTTGAPRSEAELRRDIDACTARSSGIKEETRDRLGREFTASDPDDPMSPEGIAAIRSNLELSQCIPSKGWSGRRQ
jgi:hypothetical protein